MIDKTTCFHTKTDKQINTHLQVTMRPLMDCALTFKTIEMVTTTLSVYPIKVICC